jgi:YrbI family 3-deoxy-D-manno-octulosonate 8-phosphate phosphatase
MTFHNGEIKLDEIHAIFFDFDGVLTNNKVLVDSLGVESVVCSRSDGLAFDMLRKLNVNVFIFSTETNDVVVKRSKKLKVPVLNSIDNKRESLLNKVTNEGWSLSKVVYVGNDLNDYYAMEICGFRFCPFDAHPTIQSISDKILTTKGGDGVVRELVEEVFEVNFLKLIGD